VERNQVNKGSGGLDAEKISKYKTPSDDLSDASIKSSQRLIDNATLHYTGFLCTTILFTSIYFERDVGLLRKSASETSKYLSKVRRKGCCSCNASNFGLSNRSSKNLKVSC